MIYKSQVNILWTNLELSFESMSHAYMLWSSFDIDVKSWLIVNWIVKLQSSDEELPAEEEAEVLRLQREKAKSLSMEDFGLDDVSQEDSDGEPTLEVRSAFRFIVLTIFGDHIIFLLAKYSQLVIRYAAGNGLKIR